MTSVSAARRLCLESLRTQDRSSYILQSYLPARARDAFIASRAFNLKISAVVDDSRDRQQFSSVRFEFWKTVIQRSISAKSNGVPQEPVAVLLHEGSRNVQLQKRYLITLVQTREAHVGNKTMRSTDSMASYGEGTYSQLNYLLYEALLSLDPDLRTYLEHELEGNQLDQTVRDILAHIGQATGITSFLRGFQFFVTRKGHVALPVDVMAKHGLAQEEVINAYDRATDARHLPKDLIRQLSDVFYDTATRANDHLLSAQMLVKGLKTEETLREAMFLPMMAALPTKLYLERLERANFNPADPKLQQQEWRLPLRSYLAHWRRNIY